MDAPLSLGSLPRVGETIDRYEVVAEIASGGMAIVYAVRRKGIGGFDKLLALKLILPHLAAEDRFVQMLLDEARIASQIHHPNVVQVFDVGDAGGVPFMVMEFLRGHSFARVVKKALATETPLPPAFTLAVLARAADGLHAAHETLGTDGQPLGIVHRDVSPQNFHVCYNGQVKVVDFGIAAARGKLTMTRTGELKGKLSYLAPEQLARASGIDRRADVWALGVVAWEMLAGKRLFRTDEEASTLDNIIRMPVPDLRAHAPGLPETVYRCISSCLERDVGRRLGTLDEVGRVLADGAGALGCPHASDIAAYMDELFATEKAIEQERLATAVAGPRPLREPDTGSSMNFAHPDTVNEPLPLPPSRGLPKVLLLVPVVFAVLLGAGLALLLGGDDPPAEVAVAAPPAAPGPVPAAAPPAPAPPTPPASPADPETTSITLEVDPRARLVLVDGVRVEGRPVRVDLGPTDTATVELFYPNGETVRRVVRASDDGLRIGPGGRPERPATEPHPIKARIVSATPPAPAGGATRPVGTPPRPTPPRPPATPAAGSRTASGGSGTAPRAASGGSGTARSGASGGSGTARSGTSGSGTGGRRRGSGSSPLLGSPY